MKRLKNKIKRIVQDKKKINILYNTVFNITVPR